MDSTLPRQERRRESVNRFLSEIGTMLQRVGDPTQKHLDGWARQVQLIEDQPSANWDNAVLQLCKAIESELALTLGKVRGLGFLASKGNVGAKASWRRKHRLDGATEQRLKAKGFKPGFVVRELPRLLGDLADLRSDTDSAHGGIEIRSASKDDGLRARRLAVKIFRGITRT